MAQPPNLSFNQLLHPFGEVIEEKELRRLQEVEKNYIRLEIACRCLLDADTYKKLMDACNPNLK